MACELTIELREKDGRGIYTLTTTSRAVTGYFQLENDGIIFSELFASDTNASEPQAVTAVLEEGSLLIQNYGNSMNPYTVFGECAPKYLMLDRISAE
ncbi:hypothetical protein BGP77_12055 [Saccharospirillum sp. MSK14-1]|nr:hypothetical protein BGP77_12055 [Saccharospirillum sp. MSK14-1]